MKTSSGSSSVPVLTTAVSTQSPEKTPGEKARRTAVAAKVGQVARWKG
jgi:hypothetical protein